MGSIHKRPWSERSCATRRRLPATCKCLQPVSHSIAIDYGAINRAEPANDVDVRPLVRALIIGEHYTSALRCVALRGPRCCFCL